MGISSRISDDKSTLSACAVASSPEMPVTDFSACCQSRDVLAVLGIFPYSCILG
jgi:hypothetical protein